MQTLNKNELLIVKLIVEISLITSFLECRGAGRYRILVVLVYIELAKNIGGAIRQYSY